MGYFDDQEAPIIAEKDQKLLNHSEQNLDEMLFGNAETTPISQSTTATSTATVATTSSTSGYNLILVRIDPKQTIPDTILQLNQSFKKQNLPAKAITWKAALGQVAQMASLMRAILFGFVMIVFIVAIIVITNTLSLAAMERITEIGMMRAIGAHRRFISWLFITETGVLSIVFGLAGIGVGTLLVMFLRLLHIQAANNLVELFYGGTTFKPLLSITDIGLGILQLVVVTVVSVIYPILIARKISPMDAISRE